MFTLFCFRPFLFSKFLPPIRWSSSVGICAPSPQSNMKRSPSAYLNDENLCRTRRSRRSQFRTPGTRNSAPRTSALRTSAASQPNQSWSPPPHPLPEEARSSAPRTPPRTSALRSPRPHAADEAGRTPFGPWPRMGVHPSELLKEYSASGQPSRNILKALAMRPVVFSAGHPNGSPPADLNKRGALTALHRSRAPPRCAVPDGVVSVPARFALLDRWIPPEAPTPFPLPSGLHRAPPSLTPQTPLSAPVLMALASSTTRHLFHQAPKGQLVHFRRFIPRMVVASSHPSLSMLIQDTSLMRDFEPKSTAPLHTSLRMQSSVPLSVRA